MAQQQTRQAIANSLTRFPNGSLAENAIDFFGTMGYASEKRIELHPPTAANFRATFATNGAFNADKALLHDWQSVHLLFQLTADEIRAISQLKLDFIAHALVDDTIIESYLFFAIALQNDTYTRSQLATITREVNRLFKMPVTCPPKTSPGKMLDFGLKERGLFYGKKDVYGGADHQQAPGG